MNWFIWFKTAHIFGVIAWFAGLFYLPRLFAYHADAADKISQDRFVVMERRLYAMMSIGAGIALTFGICMLIHTPAYLSMHWLWVKLVLVVLLIVYHQYCDKLKDDFADGKNTKSAKWYRGFNEVPSLLLIAILILVVVKPF
jgi:protoporphyrinogen IX oxidase